MIYERGAEEDVMDTLDQTVAAGANTLAAKTHDAAEYKGTGERHGKRRYRYFRALTAATWFHAHGAGANWALALHAGNRLLSRLVQLVQRRPVLISINVQPVIERFLDRRQIKSLPRGQQKLVGTHQTSSPACIFRPDRQPLSHGLRVDEDPRERGFVGIAHNS